MIQFFLPSYYLNWYNTQQAELKLKFFEEITSAALQTGKLYSPKEEIHHVFRQPEKRPPSVVSTVFTTLTLLPLLILLILVSLFCVLKLFFKSLTLRFLFFLISIL